jgi:prepilin-type N-terminal cleavage/methylation domain-containing protein
MKNLCRKDGFTLIELLMVVTIIGVLFSVALPVSYNLYRSYSASLSAHDVMIFVSGIRREAFVYSERKVIASEEDHMMVDGEKKLFKGVRLHVSPSIVFYPNGTSSGGDILLTIGEDAYRIEVKSPMGDLSLMKI